MEEEESRIECGKLWLAISKAKNEELNALDRNAGDHKEFFYPKSVEYINHCPVCQYVKDKWDILLCDYCLLTNLWEEGKNIRYFFNPTSPCMKAPYMLWLIALESGNWWEYREQARIIAAACWDIIKDKDFL